MKRQSRYRRSLALVLVSLAWSSAGLGGLVYQYRDQQGAMAFSDSPPSHTNDYIVIEMPDAPEPEPEPRQASGDAPAPGSIEEMIAVTERLEAARREREEAERQRQAAQQQPEAAPQPYGAPESRGPGYLYPDYLLPYPRTPRAAPPYSVDRPGNAADRRLRELKTPLRIPQFGGSESLQERIEPFNPPQRPPRRH